MMIDRVRVQFTGGYATQRGPRFCRGDVAALLPDEADDVLRRHLGVLVAAPPVNVVSPEEVRMTAYAHPPAHTQIVDPDVAKSRRHFYKRSR